MKNRSLGIVVLTVFALSTLLFFTSIDNKIFDLFLRIPSSLEENEKVYVLTLDDASMEFAGGFPFRREVMADVVVLLRELGVDTIAFDLSYLDDSARRFDPNYAAEVLNQFRDSGLVTLDEIDDEKIKELGRDVDEYFAQALAFSDCSWLTLTFLSSEAFISDDDNEITLGNEEIDQYLAEYISLKNVIDAGDTKTHEMAGVMPAIQKLLTRARGAGFVNADPDSDGLRRRVNLLLKYNDDYYGHLTLMGIQKKLGWTSIEASNKFITLKFEDKKDLRIPRTEDGSVLLKWPKKNFYDYYFMSLVQLIQYTTVEPVFAKNVEEVHNSGLFGYLDSVMSPWDYYLIAENIKKSALLNNEAASEEWLFMRQSFFDSMGEFLNGPYEEYILYDVAGYEALEDWVQDLFEACRAQYNLLAEIRENAESLRGSFCVVGSDATSMMDIGLTTFQEFYPNVGTYTTLANMLLAGDFLDDAPWYVSAIIALIYSLIIGILIRRFDTYKAIITGIAGLLLLTGGLIVYFLITKTYLGLAAPLFATAGTFISIMIIKFLTTSREKAFIHNAFSRYLAPEVISQIINDPSKLNLGGEKREMTAIFTDIQGFSTISEQLDPTHLVALLNKYLTIMSNIIMKNQGTIDKYEGDAIIAFFGAPLHYPNHPSLACRSALEMKAAEREINKTVVEEGLSPVPLHTRIGINTGDMVVGNMGAENKMDYTIMGNAVNLTARLEGVNKHYRTGGILISEYTRDKIGDEFLLRRLDRVRVVGINTPLRLYELLAINDIDLDMSEKKAVEMWEQAMNLYEGKNFKEAFAAFRSLMEKNPEDKVAELYAIRCKKYAETPPPESWDAVNNLTEK